MTDLYKMDVYMKSSGEWFKQVGLISADVQTLKDGAKYPETTDGFWLDRN